MPTTQARQDFLLRTRQLAHRFIQASDAFNALYAEAQIAGLLLPEAAGGLGPDDCTGLNQDIDAESVATFYLTVGGMLQPLTDVQKRALYRVRSGSPLGPGPGW